MKYGGIVSSLSVRPLHGLLKEPASTRPRQVAHMHQGLVCAYYGAKVMERNVIRTSPENITAAVPCPLAVGPFRFNRRQ